MTDNGHPPALASIVLLRLRDYARRPVAEQARLSAQLDAVLAVLLPDIPPHERIVLEGKGSAAVAVLDNAPAALALAERALRGNDAGMTLSIGIDHGAVELVPGESGHALTGDGVATASVTAAFATDHGLLVSRNFRTALAARSPGAESILTPTGRFSGAGLRSYQVFHIDRTAPARRRLRLMLISVAALVALIGVAIGIRLGVPDRPRPLEPFLTHTVVPVINNILGRLRGNP